MENDALEKVYEIVDLLEGSKDIEKLQSLKEELFKDQILLEKIQSIKQQKEDYTLLKEEVLLNDKLREYRLLENDLYFLIQEINIRLKKLVRDDV